MYFKRNESYRYTFAQPVAGKLTKKDTSHKVTTDVHIRDVSLQGAKLYCQNTIELRKNTAISLSFQLNNMPFQAAGNIVWIKTYPRWSELGVYLDTDDEYREMLTWELKQIAKQKIHHP
ncbi:PilZ domain-containing protein [Lentibacillus salinarum]|uniref:PilZ domain-containing protein n=1 Tax=Lentibacillus salinarum TaxID=446820 RepID=A0ABW3ZSZ6_9BACI